MNAIASDIDSRLERLYLYAVDYGIATDGDTTELVDISRFWQDDIWYTYLLFLYKPPTLYAFKISSNSENTLSFSALRSGIKVRHGDRYWIVPDVANIQSLVTFSSADQDAFSRLRVSNPTTEFDSQHQYNLSPLYWNYKLIGGGTITFLPNEATALMTNTTASGDQVIYQTKPYMRYQPSKSLEIYMTGVFAPGITNLVQRIGYYDDYNGIFFQLSGNTLSVVKRTYISGAVVDNVINQSNWNIDKLDGNGPSGITIDPTKAQIFFIDIQWLGVGRVRMGFDIDGQFIYVHEFLAANHLTSVYMTTANLPIRYETLNSGPIAASSSMKAICSTVNAEGGFEESRAITHTANNGTTGKLISTKAPLINIRPKLTFNGLTNRGQITPIKNELLNNTGTDNIFWQLILNGTLGGTPVWTSAGSNSLIEYDVAATTITGGEVLDSGYIASTATPVTNPSQISAPVQSPFRDIVLTLGIDGTTYDTLSLVCTAVTPTAQSLLGSITVREIY